MLIVQAGAGIPHAFATNAFQEDSEKAVGLAISALRAQPVEDTENVSFSMKDKWIRGFSFPASWLATLKSRDTSTPPKDTLQNFTAKKLKQLIYDKGNANVRVGKSDIQLYAPLETYMNPNAFTPEELYALSAGEQILLLRPIQNPIGADEWSGTMILLWITPSNTAITSSASSGQSSSTSSEPTTVDAYTQTLFSGKVPSARDITTEQGTLFGKTSRAFSFAYRLGNVDYRFREENVTMDDAGTRVEYFVRAPESIFTKVRAAGDLFIASVTLAQPEAMTSSSSSPKSQGVKIVIPRSCASAQQKKLKRCQRYYPQSSSASSSSSSSKASR